ncbi:DUF1461 domain-containing protein [Nesterenkonia populi]|uniref:DUF1461 domain-containing protein n=1 Tax=Nesterenkonia populi TaxID=1591087 RepID=UPI0011BF0100|nr:DUF1461 domain-containing protein [Nesterenkonia populi]
MSQNPDEQRQNDAAEKDFESGLDYGAFTTDEPDFPEDRIGAEEAEPSAAPAAGAPAPQDTDEDAPGASSPQQAAPAAPDQPQRTRSLSEELAAAKASTSEDRADAAASASAEAPASAAEVPTKQDTAAENASKDVGYPEDQEDAEPTAVVPPATREEPTRESTRTDAPSEDAAKQAAGRRHAEEEVRRVPGSGAAPAGAARTPADEEITDADIDEEVRKSRRGISRFLTVLIAIFTPVLIIAAAVRFVASPLFLWATYNRPGFPADGSSWGLSTADRELYGSYGMDYLFNIASTEYLSNVLYDGQQLFTADEVAHMYDVKLVVWWIMTAGVVLAALTLLFLLMLRAWRPGGFARGLFAGAWVTLALIVAAGVLAVLDWQTFFAEFHRIAFFWTDNPWAFDGAESGLLALYPNQFWIDAAIWGLGFVVLLCLIIILATWPTRARRERRAERLAVVQERRREKLIAEINKSNYA